MLLLALAWSAPARAADALPPAIPDSFKQTADISDTQTQQIDADVKSNALILSDSSDTKLQSDARKWITDAASGNSSPAFLHALAQSVNNQLLPVISSKTASFRGRLEAGLAAASVAKAAQGTDLIPLATAMLNDSSSAIVFAGMKTAAAQVAPILNNPSPSPAETAMLKQMIAAVQQHPEPPLSGSIFAEAASAISEPVRGPNNNAVITKAAVPLIFQLEAIRLTAYAGETPPEDPYSDCRALFAFFGRDVWTNGLTPKDQVAALNLTSQFIQATAKFAGIASVPGKFDPAPFVDALKSYGGELRLFANPNNGIVNDADLDQAGAKLRALYVGSGPAAINAASGLAKQAIDKFVAK